MAVDSDRLIADAVSSPVAPPPCIPAKRAPVAAQRGLEAEGFAQERPQHFDQARELPARCCHLYISHLSTSLHVRQHGPLLCNALLERVHPWPQMKGLLAAINPLSVLHGPWFAEQSHQTPLNYLYCEHRWAVYVRTVHVLPF